MTPTKRISSHCIAAYAVVATLLGPFAIHGFQFRNSNYHWTTHASLTRKTLNANIFSFNSFPSKRNSLTTIYGKSGAGDFKDINIDDVLLEAQTALETAQNSLNENAAETETVTEIKTEFKDINIDDVLLQAESALNAAQTSIGDESKEESDMGNFKSTIRESLLSDDQEDKASIEAIEIVSSTLGGILFASLLGSFATFQLTDMGVLEFGAETVSSIFAFMILGGIAGFGGSMQDNSTGFIVRKVLGVPARALASAIVRGIQESIRQQVDKTAQSIKSIPSNVANSAKDAAVQKAREAKLAVDVAIEVFFQKLLQVFLATAAFASLVVLGIYLTNGQVDLPPLDFLSQ